MSATPAHLDVMAIAADAKDPRTIDGGTHEAGVFRTTDGGATWTAVDTGLGGLDVHGLALDPSVSAKRHAAVREQGEGIYRTAGRRGRGWVHRRRSRPASCPRADGDPRLLPQKTSGR